MDVPQWPAEAPRADWVAVDSCTLPTADQPLRVAEFDDLFATALCAVERPDVPGRARLVLAGDRDLPDRVHRLAEAETACCSFFVFTLSPVRTGSADADGTVLALDIEVPTERTDVLAALVRRAERALRAGA